MSAAGVVLGERIPPAVAAGAFAVERIAHDCVRYSFDSVRVSTRFGLANEIAVSARYRGTIGGAIGIGSSVADVEAHSGGAVVADLEGRLVPRAAGWCFETAQRAVGEPPVKRGDARVAVIIVFAPPGAAAATSPIG